MAKIDLELTIGSKIAARAEGIIDDKGHITYMKKEGAIPLSYGQFNLNDVYKQLLELANKRGYKNKHFEINMKIEKQ